MKNFKFNAALVALFLGVSLAFAFKAPAAPRAPRTLTEWYVYDGSGSQTDPANYAAFGQNPPTTCSGTAKVCTIQAVDDGSGSPEITTSLSNEINADLMSGHNSGNVKLRN